MNLENVKFHVRENITGAVILVLIVLIIRELQIAPAGGGRGAESPDKRFLAMASDYRAKRFWGGVHNYYEFAVTTAGGELVHHVIMDEPPQGMIDWREDGVIQWASNNSSVTYSFSGAQVTLNMGSNQDITEEVRGKK